MASVAGILRLARVIGDAFAASELLGSGYAQRAVEAARHAAQAEREADELDEARAAEEVLVAEKGLASEAKAEGRAAARLAAEVKAKMEPAAAACGRSKRQKRTCGVVRVWAPGRPSRSPRPSRRPLDLRRACRNSR